MLAEVALPLPLFRTFTYAVPERLRHPLVPGSRVVVPLRTGKEVGIYLGPGDPRSLGSAAPKAILDAPDAEPSVTPALLAVCRWIADYYIVPLGVALRCALPALLTGAAAPEPAQRTRRVATVRRHLESLLHRERIFGRAPQQRALFELLESFGGRAAVDHLTERMAFSPSVLKGLVARGLVEVRDEIVARDPFASRAGSATPPVPSAEQRAAVEAIAAGRGGETFLLHGVTGSGKTLVYIELLRQVLARGRGAIVLVPEIALTPQTVDRFRGAFGDQVAVLHSALSDGERYDAWLALRRGEKRIAVGARSAIFAPVADLGAVVVDEEHESSYKQGESPRYHAREVAIVRARAEGAVVVLGSATPSLESWTNAASGKYRLLTLPERVGGARLPAVDVIDLRVGIPRSTLDAPRLPDPSVERGALTVEGVLSRELQLALADRIEKGEQSILLLNRRGYAAYVQCNNCGDVATCPNCSIALTYHRTPEQLVCHYCLHTEPPRVKCARCGGPTLRQRGLGTQQVERILAERFPAARIARMDVDTTGAKWAHTEILDRVARGEVDILLGTQMIAKGLDFPNVTLVGVIDADTGINLPDFRASERCFQLLSQVAGRAGRGPKGGRVLIQTRVPTHHAVRCAVRHDYGAFVGEELPSRMAPAYPPAVRLANVVISGTDETATAELAQKAATWVERLLARAPGDAVRLVGPAPCPVERIKQRWRWHFLLKAERPAELTRVARYFLERFAVPKRAGLRVALDRDPVALL
ncbi:primosomal protein N [Gemmatirosa kalamazoonensis]|uniref:Replication restart protein PriA n=1 Tax=Gemmatirosa kalamazoonensis TaxID=861299 RepID=W0RIU7_9BACT|nr:primosomal protein N' [Gemmatirosa kalamazoonensis]AHG90362.1 primosomal protein N [Gemmatirosa kalamazoonensis]